MKKNYHLNFKNAAAFLIVMFAFIANLLAQTPQYYNYNTVVGTNYFPFGVTAGKQVQWLVGPGEYNQPTPAPSGNITKLYFMMGFTNGNATLTSLTIKLGQTALTALPAGVIYTGTLDTVYYRASVNLISTIGQWMMITLDRPFSYNPAQSLVIDVSQCGATNVSVVVCQTALTPGRRNYINHLGGCSFSFSGQDNNVANCGVDIGPASCSYLWATQTSGVTNLFQAAWASSGLVAWVAGAAGTVRKTTDGGTTWTNGNPNPGIINGDIYCINALDVNNALVTTSPGSTFIYRTTNGGTNWTQVFTQATPGFIDAMIMKDANTGFAYGDPVSTRWQLWKTVNGGATWDSTGMYLAQVGTEAGWNNSMCIIGNDIWFGTNNTKVYHSTNFGATGSWTAGVTTGNVSTYGVWFSSATNGVCVGTIAQYTTNGGTTWTNAGPVGGAGNMTSVGGSGTNFWLTRGTNIYASTDNGATWTAPYGYTGTQALWATNVTAGTNGCLTGWSSGATGTIVKLTGTPIAVNNNHNEVPNVYMLEQNYPNPFNPSTTINFAIPKAGNVELKIYDILGREAAILVNEFRQAGNYSIEFNAAELASGMYFYTIRSGDFTDTKKMVLIK